MTTLIKTTFGPYTVTIGKSLEPSEWLINASYWKKGYEPNHTLADMDVVIDAHLFGSVVGTVLVKLDSSRGLGADESYSGELDALRRKGCSLVELSRFSILPGQRTKSVMGAMFHLVYYYAHLLNNATDLICEVVPRHVTAQKYLLGLEQIAGPRRCDRVGAEAAVLLHRTLEWS